MLSRSSFSSHPKPQAARTTIAPQAVLSGPSELHDTELHDDLDLYDDLKLEDNESGSEWEDVVEFKDLDLDTLHELGVDINELVDIDELEAELAGIATEDFIELSRGEESTPKYLFRWLCVNMEARGATKEDIAALVLPHMPEGPLKTAHCGHWSPETPSNPEWTTQKNPNVINDPSPSLRRVVRVYDKLQHQAWVAFMSQRLPMYDEAGARLNGDEPYKDSPFLDLFEEYSRRLFAYLFEERGTRNLIAHGEFAQAFVKEMMEDYGFRGRFPHVSHILSILDFS